MQFILCFGRELLVETHKSGAAATAPPMKNIHRPNAKPLEIDDFSVNRVENHYLEYHRWKRAAHKSRIKEKGMFHETKDVFFEWEKITSHYARQLHTSVIKRVSLEIFALANLFYSSYPSLAEFGVSACVA